VLELERAKFEEELRRREEERPSECFIEWKVLLTCCVASGTISDDGGIASSDEEELPLEEFTDSSDMDDFGELTRAERERALQVMKKQLRSTRKKMSMFLQVHFYRSFDELCLLLHYRAYLSSRK
jgi:hypothetical protein